MKKTALSLLLAAAALFSACGAAPDTAPLATPTPDPAAAAEPTPEPQNGEFYALDRLNAAFNSGDAYYEFAPKLGYCLLLKTDYATAAQTVCCEIPGCTHDTEDCPAYFPGKHYYVPFVAEGQLYVLNASFFTEDRDMAWEDFYAQRVAPQLENPSETFDGMSGQEIEKYYYGLWQQQKTDMRLYTVNPAGENTYQDLPKESREAVFDYCDGTSLYGMVTSGAQGQNKEIIRVSLADGSMETLTLESTEEWKGVYDGALLTMRYVTDAPLPDDWEQYMAAIQSATVEFDRYDPRTGERRKLIERPYNIADERLSGYLGTHNGKLYFEEREALQDGGYNRGALQEYDPADGSTATVWDAPPTGNLWDYQDTYTNVLPARGSRAEDWLWLYGTDGAVGGNRCYLMNAATRELVPITQRMKNYAYDIPPSRLAQTADGRWLLWTESNDENAHVAYGLIAPNDFAAGSTAYTPVEMWAG